jgi:hypothetical protein
MSGLGCWRCGRFAEQIAGCDVPGCGANQRERREREHHAAQMETERLRQEALKQAIHAATGGGT